MKITIQQNELKAVAYAMPKNDVRFYLNGVYVESNRAETRLVATDGARLHAVVSFDNNALVDAPVSAILPYEFVKKLLAVKWKRGERKAGALSVNIDGPRLACATPDGNTITGLAIDGRLPDWRRVIPAEASGEHANADPELIADAYNAARAYLKHSDLCPARIVWNGNGAAMLSVDRFLAIVMPYREYHAGSSKPHEAFTRPLQKPEHITE